MLRIHRLALSAVALAIILTGTLVASAQRSRPILPRWEGDLITAQFVEVRDRSGQVLLHGALATTKDTPKEIEREADLANPSGQPGKGDVEIGIDRKDGVVKETEIEIEVKDLPAGLDCDVFIDGRAVGSLVTSKKGKGELELEWKTTGGR